MIDVFGSFSSNKMIFENIKNAIISVDSSGIINFVNNRALELLNMENKECIGKHIYEIYKDSQLPTIIKKNIIEKDVKIEILGKNCIVTRMPIFLDEKIIGAIAIFDDITLFRNLEKKIEEDRSEIKILKLILELVYDGIIVVDKDGYITMISDTYKKFLGLEESDVINKHVTEVIENTRMHIVASTGVSEINDFQRIDSDYIVATRIPYYVNGKIAGAIGKVIFRNISQLEDINKKFSKMEQELKSYKSEFFNLHNAKYDLKSIISQNNKIDYLKKNLIKIAKSNSNVLILGESGTGKELFAHSIHINSNRSSMPFVKFNCAAIPENLLEAELFGYEKGAFTGASSTGKFGKFELADNGTIFLDEIGDMPLQMQAKILRVLQEGEVERIGSNKPKNIDVRIVAATNKDLSSMVSKKLFREDLYYRLNVFSFNIPPLRERKEDIILIAEKYIDDLNLNTHRNVLGISKKAINLLQSYNWPGNIRELKNVIERAYNIMEGEEFIQPWHLPSSLKGNSNNHISEPLKEIVEKTEKKVIIERLIYFNGNKSKTAADLNISRVALHKKLIKYGLN